MSSDPITRLILAIMRANSRLILRGDQLTAPIGLTSARWQVLGSVAEVDSARTVSELARGLGVSRQGVQRICGELVAEGTLAYQPNPCHKRAQLVVFTTEGRRLYDRALAVQAPWARSLAENLTPEQIETATIALGVLTSRLEEELQGVRATVVE
ncbi:MarR family winged helix-turn-helix transcriptional regulator [Notoacmeibacter ruber]|uniref:MarR family transcriptional regulator n=1 Tax=Notoacmeibacter ruber TaxID=2670375 RepID=A0A3L7JBS6_9HYPH|nr:MarR family winged helix-turn-helix transcriptional regulator [Notoacmeibacter ruber]RLQ88093.1 MarR family transcriptional regulator [Notoacmeibacter ruber]